MLKSEVRFYSFSNDLHLPRHYSINGALFLNQCKGFKHKKYLQYDEYDEKIKMKVQMFIDFIKLVLCSNRDDVHDALMKYFSILANGRKTKATIVAKTMEQGVGKSTLTDFIINHVFGQDICLYSSTQPLTSDRNKILIGKLFVVFEELPTFSTSEWNAACSMLKKLATEDMMTFRGLYENEIQLRHCINCWINTNVDAIKDTAGRRNIVLDINVNAWESKESKKEYFDDLYSTCFSDEVGEAFFSYLVTKIDSKNFNVQEKFPDTENKLNAIASQLPSPYKFIKEEYILNRLDIEKTKTESLYTHYKNYCGRINRTAIINKNDFIAKLEVVGIKRKDIKNSPYYKETAKDLYDIAMKNKWISPTELEEMGVEVKNDNSEDDEEEEDNDNVSKEKDKDTQINKLLAENEALKRIIKDLEYKMKNNELEKKKVEELPKIQNNDKKQLKNHKKDIVVEAISGYDDEIIITEESKIKEEKPKVVESDNQSEEEIKLRKKFAKLQKKLEVHDNDEDIPELLNRINEVTNKLQEIESNRKTDEPKKEEVKKEQVKEKKEKKKGTRSKLPSNKDDLIIPDEDNYQL